MALVTEKGRMIDTSTGSSRENLKGFTVLHLRGDPRERGMAHGLLMKKEILSSGIASYYGDFLKTIIFSRAFFRSLPRRWRESFYSFVEDILYKPLEMNISDHTRMELEGVAEATSIDLSLIMRALLAPDMMQLLISGLLRGGKKGNGNYYLGGCSAAYASGSAMKAGKGALLARNLDFPGALVWKYPVIIYHHPTEKNEVPVKGDEGQWSFVEKTKQPYMYISAAGFPGTGLTGLNQSGIAMSTFICISHESSRHESPSLDYNHRIFTALEDLEALPELIKRYGNKSAVPHVLLLADKKRGLALEISSKRSFVREMAPGFDTLIQTNHFLGPPMKKGEIAFTLERESTLERYRHMRDALEMHHGNLDPRKMVHIISSAYNRFSGKIDLSGSPTPAQPDTLMSVVLEPRSGDFWVASGRPPGICFNRYCGFNSLYGLELSDYEQSTGDIKSAEWSIFNDRVRAHPGSDAQESLRYYSLAGEQMKTGKESRAVKLLEKALSIYEDPGYFYTLAILYIRCGCSGKALKMLDEISLRFRFTPLRDSLIPLWQGRCHDLEGRRQEAVAAYERGLAIPGLAVEFARAYKEGLRKKFTLSQLPITVNFNNPGSVKL